MLNKRLLGLVPGALRHVLATVGAQWVGLLADIALIWSVCDLLFALAAGTGLALASRLAISLVACAAKLLATRLSGRESFAAASDVKRILRHEVYEKLLRLGPGYTESMPTAEVMQLAVEGCEQLETYFGQYLPQLLFSVLAPVTLFVVLFPLSWQSALVLLVFVPLIPLAIVLVQKIAKRILSSYWDEYTGLGDSFLENLQGLTTLKIYQADAARHEAMDQEAERFRVVTMQVLRMQLNSIIVMDVVALGGAAAGIAVALFQLSAGALDLRGALLVVLLSADFFLPMRRLGSYFHIAMNGMAASDKIFRLLDLEESLESGTDEPLPGDHLLMSHVGFSWDGEREVLRDVSIDVPAVGLTAIVGESGSGKSTAAALLSGRAVAGSGSVLLGGRPLESFSRKALARYVTCVPSASYLFAGSVRENLQMGDPDASEEAMWAVLEGVELAAFLRAQEGLDTRLGQRGENLSGGQRQRLALARALLHNSPIYILDEATSNIDAESEEAIMAAVRGIARYKAVVVISHRLANTAAARRIYVIDKGQVVGVGDHEQLLLGNERYRQLWESQQALEHFEPSLAPAGPGPADRSEDAPVEAVRTEGVDDAKEN